MIGSASKPVRLVLHSGSNWDMFPTDGHVRHKNWNPDLLSGRNQQAFSQRWSDYVVEHRAVLLALQPARSNARFKEKPTENP